MSALAELVKSTSDPPRGNIGEGEAWIALTNAVFGEGRTLCRAVVNRRARHGSASASAYSRQWDRWCSEELGLSKQAVSYYETMAENLVTIGDDVRQKLPASWRGYFGGAS